MNVATGFTTLVRRPTIGSSRTRFAVQEEIARAVVAALKVKLVPDQPLATPHATVPEACDWYLVGRQVMRRNTFDDAPTAVKAYEDAIALDSGFAPAWAGLAFALTWVGDVLPSRGERAVFERRAFAAAEKALALDPELAEGYSARAFLRSLIAHDWAGAQRDFDRALALGGGDADTLIRYAAFFLVPLGRAEEAVTVLEKAARIDPLSAAAWGNLGWAELVAGRYARAREGIVRALEISPDAWIPASLLSTVFLLEGRPADALASSKRISVEPFRLMHAASAQHSLGRAREAGEALDALIAGHAQSAAYQIACVHAWRGEHDRAFEWLDRAYAQRDAGLAWLKTDPLLRGLRGNPRFATLLGKLNLPVE